MYKISEEIVRLEDQGLKTQLQTDVWYTISFAFQHCISCFIYLIIHAYIYLLGKLLICYSDTFSNKYSFTASLCLPEITPISPLNMDIGWWIEFLLGSISADVAR